MKRGKAIRHVLVRLLLLVAVVVVLADDGEATRWKQEMKDDMEAGATWERPGLTEEQRT